MLTLTAIWQLVTLPAVRVYRRASHGDAVPHLSNPVPVPPRHRRVRPHDQLGDAGAYRLHRPWAVGDEVVQRLLVHPAEARGHRLDRLTPHIEHQPLQILGRPILPAGPRPHREHMRGETAESITQPVNLNDVRTSTTATKTPEVSITHPNATKHY
jgi:hypothetical protein